VTGALRCVLVHDSQDLGDYFRGVVLSAPVEL